MADEVVIASALAHRLLARLGVASMTHNGHIGPSCPRSWPDWIESDECNCGRDADVLALKACLDVSHMRQEAISHFTRPLERPYDGGGLSPSAAPDPDGSGADEGGSR